MQYQNFAEKCTNICLKCHSSSSTFKSKQIQSLQLSNLSFICFVKQWWKTTPFTFWNHATTCELYLGHCQEPHNRQITSATTTPKKVNFQDLTLPKTIKLEALL